MAGRTGPRPLWVTVPLYLLAAGVAGVDVWAAVFWAQVGGSLGMVIAGAAIAVVLIMGVLVAFDLWRQRLLAAEARENE